MVASTEIKFYVHTNNNAPQLQNAFGCMIDVLDACLVNGFAAQTVATLTASGTTVTATFGSAHNFMLYQVVKIAGANQTEYNGEHRILTIPNANSITFQLAGNPIVSTATGTITCSLPPLGWLKPFSGTGKAAYRSANTLLASRPYLRVVDALDPAYNASYAKYAKVGIVENMTDIDTMLGVQSPYDPSNPNKNWIGSGSGTNVINGWAKWYYARSNDWQVDSNSDILSIIAGSRSWYLVGNDSYFYIFPNATTNRDFKFPYGFGNFQNYFDTDMYHNFLASTLDNSTAGTSTNKGGLTALASSTSQTFLLQRNKGNTPESTSASLISMSNKLNNHNSGSMDYLAAVSTSGGYITAPVIILENGNLPRGALPSLQWIFQGVFTNSVYSDGDNAFLIVATTCANSANGSVAINLGRI